MTIWGELKRRNVVKVGIAYLALAWVVIQVTNLAVPAFHLPESVNSVVFYFGLIFFPFVLLIAWAFEITPEGVVLTSKMDPDDSILHITGRRLDFIIIALMALAIVFLWFKDPPAVIEDPVKLVGEKSIAVLPFVNMSGDSENEFFSDGISEEILDGLAGVSGLKVIARTSSFYFKGKSESITTIGESLNVATVLEGSVRKAGNRVRITAQLIRVSDQTHLWSEIYDRELDDVFAIQDEIAHAIVIALALPLGVASDKPIVRVGTKAPAAYEAFSRGKALSQWSSYKETQQAIAYLNMAVTLDPNYAQAYGYLAYNYVLLTIWRPISTQLPDITRSYQSALALNPNQPEALAARAFAMLVQTWDWKMADELFQQIHNQTSNANAMQLHASAVLLPLEEMDRAQKMFEQAMELDPLHPGHVINLAYGLSFYGGSEEKSRALYEKGLILAPNHLLNINNYCISLIFVWSDFKRCQPLLEKMEVLGSKEDLMWVDYIKGLTAGLHGDLEVAKLHINNMAEDLELSGGYTLLAEIYLLLEDEKNFLRLSRVPPINNQFSVIYGRLSNEVKLIGFKKEQEMQALLNLDDVSLIRMGYLTANSSESEN